MSTQITHRAIGINWVWYHIYDLDKSNMTAHLVKEWREHLYEKRASASKSPDKSNAKEYNIISGHNISQWDKDGRPGGFDGCKNNYRRTPQIEVDSGMYTII